jgi:hypothetical protein
MTTMINGTASSLLLNCLPEGATNELTCATAKAKLAEVFYLVAAICSVIGKMDTASLKLACA